MYAIHLPIVQSWEVDLKCQNQWMKWMDWGWDGEIVYNREVIEIIFWGGWEAPSWKVHIKMTLGFCDSQPRMRKALTATETQVPVGMISLDSLHCYLFISETALDKLGTTKNQSVPLCTVGQICPHISPLGNNLVLRRHILLLHWREDETKTNILLATKLICSKNNACLFPNVSCGRK